LAQVETNASKPYVKQEMSYEQTKEFEDEIRSMFLNSKEVHFIFRTPKHGEKTIVVKDQSVLREFADNFRLNSLVKYDRVSKGTAPSLMISVTVKSPDHEGVGFFASIPDFRGIGFTKTNGDDRDWCFVGLSPNTELLYRYYFSSVLPIWYGRNWNLHSLDDYKNDYYSRSFLEDLAKRIAVLPVTPELETLKK